MKKICENVNSTYERFFEGKEINHTKIDENDLCDELKEFGLFRDIGRIINGYCKEVITYTYSYRKYQPNKEVDLDRLRLYNWQYGKSFTLNRKNQILLFNLKNEVLEKYGTHLIKINFDIQRNYLSGINFFMELKNCNFICKNNHYCYQELNNDFLKDYISSNGIMKIPDNDHYVNLNCNLCNQNFKYINKFYTKLTKKFGNYFVDGYRISDIFDLLKINKKGFNLEMIISIWSSKYKMLFQFKKKIRSEIKTILEQNGILVFDNLTSTSIEVIILNNDIYQENTKTDFICEKKQELIKIKKNELISEMEQLENDIYRKALRIQKIKEILI